MTRTGQRSHPRRRAGVGLAVLLLLVAWIAGAGPALAEGPPDTPGPLTAKDDSKISPLLRGLTGQPGEGAEPRSAQQGGAPDDGAEVTRGDPGADVPSFDPSPDSSPGLVRFDEDGNVEVYIYTESTSEAALAELRDLGARIEIVGAEWGIVQAWVPPAALDRFAALDVVRDITPPDYGVTRTGSVNTEGDAIHRANLVRELSSLTGAGVKVGVISSGVDSIASAQASGDLPATVDVNSDQPGSGDEGTALLEIVHDLAPGASLAFSGSGSSLRFVRAVEWLENDAFGGDGADIIVDDLGYYLQPWFEDGFVALAAADAVAQGVVFVSAAGNFARRHYEADFVDGGNGYHAFGANDTALAVNKSSALSVILQWNDPFDASATDYDLFVCPRGLQPTKFNIQNEFCDVSARIQNGDDSPYEVVVVSIFDPLFSARSVDIYVHEYTPGPAKRLEIFASPGAITQYGTPAGGIVGHPAVAGVIAVGAIRSSDPGHDDLESFSDYGSAEIFFPTRETRPKPEVVAIDGVAITGAGGFSNPFFGTSAAAPHVAGIAALLLEAERLDHPTSTKKAAADAVYDKLVDSAVDLGDPGVDERFGAGRADALAAVAATGQLAGVTFTVDSTGDGADDDIADGDCDNGSGVCTLRAAIEQANADLGGIINFDISGSGPHTIQPATALPTIAKPVFIDGFSQSGASAGTIRIELDGTSAGTSTDGLKIAAASSHLRGLAINRFGGNGVVLETAGEQLLEHNLIGTSTAGTADQGNGGAGVSIAGVSGVTVRTNVISGNDSHGISLSGATDASITGNFIGTVQGGASALANTGSGVHITGAATGNAVLDNTIAFNGGDGVTIESSNALKNVVRRNAIHSNTGLGVDLAPDGVTANDTRDADSGPNGLQNFPVLTAAVIGGNHFRVTGSLNSTAGTLFGLDFYSNTSCDAATNGEGRVWLGSALRATDSSGGLGFTLSTLDGDDTTSPQAPVGSYITATATGYPGDGSGSTSEFSTCIEAGSLPLLDLGADTVTVTEGATATYTVALKAQPASDVTVSLATAPDAAATVLPSSMTFTSTTWNTAQTATVSGTDDLDLVDEVAKITHGVSIGGMSYPARPTTVSVRDDDVLTLTLTHADLTGGIFSAGRLSLTEGDETTYTAVLTEQPAADVTITASFSSSVLTVAPDSLTFTPQDWDTAQDVTVRALVDFDPYPERTSIAHWTVVDGRSYVLNRVVIDVADLGPPTLTLTPESVDVDEGQTATYTVALETQPTDAVTVLPISGDSRAVRAYPERLTFTTTDWSTAQTVTLTGLLDADTRDETVSVFHLVGIVDDSLLFRFGVTVSVTDQDLPALRLAPDEIDTDEGDTATYTVTLAEAPAADLTVTVTSTDTGALTASPATLPFTTTTWSVPQTVTLTTVADNDALDEAVDVRHGATISGEDYILATLTADIEDSSSAPAFIESAPATRSVAENVPAGTNIGARVRATDQDSGDTLTYTLSGVDASFFAIVEASGQLLTKTALNHETRPSYSVTVTASDAAQNSDDIRVTIDVDNLDEPGSIKFRQSGAATVATLRDPDGGVSGESWQWAKSSNRSSGWANISGATSARYTPTSDDEGMYLRATVSYSDELGSGKTVRGVSTTEVPSPGIQVTTLVSGLSIPWDIAFTPDGTMLFTQRAGVLSSRLPGGTVQTITADFSDLFVGSEVGLMAIVVDPGFASNRRFYTCQSHTGPEVQVIAWTIDTAYTTATRVADPLVGGMPTSSTHGGCRLRFGPQRYLWIATGDGRTGTVPQDLDSLGGKILRVNAMTGAGAPGNPFPDAPLVYTYGHRNVQGLALRPGTSQMWSVEHGPEFDDEINLLTVGGNYGWDPVPGYDQSVPMTDLVKFPGAVEARWSSGSSTRATSGGIFLEGARWGVWEGRLAVATLKDRKLRLFEFTPQGALVSQVIVSAFDGTYGRLRTPMLGPNGALYVTTSNGGGADLILRVGENRPPTFGSVSPARSVAENTPTGANIGAPLAATDPDNDSLTYSLGGADAARFDIVPAAGQLLTRDVLDYELPADADQNNIYRVTVRAFDGSSTSELPVSITVTNVNEAPSFPPGETGERAVDENTAARVDIGVAIAATDPDTGDTLTYSLDTTGAASFEIVPSTGQLQTSAALDYETRLTYSFLVSVSDGKDASGTTDPTTDDSITVTIRVGPVNEAPEIEGQAASSVPERGSTFVHSYSATDPERDSIRWSLGGADSGDLMIDGGTLSFRATPDYESPADANRDNVYQVTIRASDGTNQDTLRVTVTVTNVDEAATVLLSSVQPQVDSPLTATLTDTDHVTGAVTWSWERSLNGTSNWSAIGAMSATYTPANDDVGYYLRVTASYEDREGPGKSAEKVSEAVQAARMSNGAPTFPSTGAGTRSVDENTVAGTDIGAAVTATDPDSDTLTYTLDRAGSRLFDIDDQTGQLRTKAALDHETRGSYTVTVTARDPFGLTDAITVTITVTNVNEAPEFASTESGVRSVSKTAGPGTNVGAPVAATDPDAGDTLTYALSGSDAASFGIDADTGQIVVGAGTVLDPGIQPSYSATVTARDSFGESDVIDVTITVVDQTTRPPITTFGGGGGGGGGGPSPSKIEFEWNVTRDIDELDSDHGFATGAWSDGATLWISENGPGTDDAIYAYDLDSGERREDLEFELDAMNLAPRGVWSDRVTVWVSDSGREKLFAYDLASGDRRPDSDLALPRGNHDARGIWSDGTTMWVLDGNANALFGYSMASGERVAEYALDSANDDPQGIWSDGVTVWVSNHNPKRLFAYRLPLLDEEADASGDEANEPDEDLELERVGDEEFTLLSRAGNNSPRGLWTDGDVMYVADASDSKVYTYNMPDAIDARLASLALSDVDFGEFSPGQPEYTGVPADGVTETTVEVSAQRKAKVAIGPDDTNEHIDGHQATVADGSEITVTVTSPDGTRSEVYRVRFGDTEEQQPAPSCLSGDIAVGFSFVVSAGGSVEDLEACALGRGVTALYTLDDGAFVSLILGAPAFVNQPFRELFRDGVPDVTPLVARSDGPGSADPGGDPGLPDPWPDCLRGDIATGFSLVLYAGGTVDDLGSCAQTRNVTALYSLHEGSFVSYIVGAPDFVNLPFRERFADGLAPATPLTVRSDGPPSAPDEGATAPAGN